jgi:TIR domain
VARVSRGKRYVPRTERRIVAAGAITGVIGPQSVPTRGLVAGEDSNPGGAASASVRGPDRYGAFVSYRHTDPDRQWAKWLHSKLEAYRVPRRLIASGAPSRVGRVFRDEEELAASADLSQRISEALVEARFLIVVCSPRTPESRWVNEEVKRFQGLGRADRLLALLIEGEPGQSFPPALSHLEPLAADVRPIAGESRRASRKTALLKLMAGILAVPYDELRRREDERARRRLSWLAGGATALTLTFLGLSLFAWQQWQRAEAELRISRAQTLAAQAQIAYVMTPTTAEISTAGPERGVLLALESLEAYPMVEGDLALRAGIGKLDGMPLEVAVEEGADLVGVGPQGHWLLLQTETSERVFDVVANAYRDAVQGQPQTVSDATARAAETNNDNVLARSRDGQLYVLPAEEELGSWQFGSVAIHRASDGKQLALLPHEWVVSFAAFSPDSRWLATVTGKASMDAADTEATVLVGSTVRVWEVPTGREITAVSLAQEWGIEKAVVSPEGDWLATMGTSINGRVVRLWPLWPEVLRAEACKRLTRNLSDCEWATFVRLEPRRETCPGLPVVSE